jgi:hypothetical protein
MSKSIGFKKAELFPLLAVLALTIGLAVGITKDNANAQDATDTYDVLFSAQAGEKATDLVRYSIKRSEEMQWGPSALAIAPDGSFWIANPVASNLLRFDASGNLIKIIDTGKDAIGIMDLEATGTGLYALDGGDMDPTLLQFDLNGKLLAKFALPLETQQSFSGLAVGEGGDVLLESAGLITNRLIDTNGSRDGEPVAGMTVDGVPVEPRPATEENPSHGSITVGAVTIDVSVVNSLAGVRALAANSDRTFYILVNELVVDETTGFIIDQTIHHYSTDGRLLNKARYPLGSQFVQVNHPFAVAGDGTVYALVTKSGNADIVRLNFDESLRPVLPVQRTLVEDKPEPDVPMCISRSTIASNAWSYYSNRTYLNNTNINGNCPGRGRPRYLNRGPDYYGRVAYDWGGFDTVSGYNSYMASNYQAGDINTAGVESCSRGVDCSGFVSRAWGLSAKQSTRTLPNISTRLSSVWSLRQGDIMNKYDDHVRLIDRIDGNGAYLWESTTALSLDRVHYRWLSWNDHSGYLPYKYNGTCAP